MGSFSIWHWLIVGLVILLFFGGRGKISEMMGDMAKGIKAFKKGMAEDETTTTSVQPSAANEPIKNLEHRAGQPAAASPAGTTTTLGERKIG